MWATWAVASSGEGAWRWVLVQLAVILVAARLGGWLARRLGQPEVIGEFLAGLALGPSLLGWWQPEWFAAVFRPSGGELVAVTEPMLAGIAQLGLLFLMFLVGLEADWRRVERGWQTTVTIAGAGLVVPLVVGVPLGWWLAQREGLEAGISGLPPAALFVAAALAITALPVLARILLDLQLLQTRLAALALAAAALTDLSMWPILAAVTALARSVWDAGRLLTLIGSAALVLVVLLGPVRLLAYHYFHKQMGGGERPLSLTGWSVLLVMLFANAAVASGIGMHAFFGAFLTGVALAGVPGLRAEVGARLHRLVQSFFLPVFFAYAGLQTDVSVMLAVWSWPLCLAVLVLAVAVKWGPCTLAARWSGLPWREAALLGVVMNTRGLMGLVVASIGRDVGALSPGLYALLVVMAEIMTLLTTPLILLLARKSEWETPLVAAGRLRPRPTPDHQTRPETPAPAPVVKK